MTEYSKRSINNQILNALAEGKNQNDVRDMFIMTQMTNDMTEEKSAYLLPPSVSEINVHLLGNNVIDQADFSIKKITLKLLYDNDMSLKSQGVIVYVKDINYCENKEKIRDKILAFGKKYGILITIIYIY